MKIGFIIYGSLNTLSGGYLYDRKLVEYLRGQGDMVEVISLPWRNYAAHLTDNLRFRLPFSNVIAPLHSGGVARRAFFPTKQSPICENFDILIQDELNHPSLIVANMGKHPYPVISLVHHLRCSELRPKWQNGFYRLVEKRYLQSVDGFIFNSQTTKRVVNETLRSPGLDMPLRRCSTNGSLRVTQTNKPSIVAHPPTDRFGDAISENEIIQRAKSNELRILFLGNVIYRKGLHTLLEAISNERLAINVDVVGSLESEPEYARQMQEFVAINGLSSLVTFHLSLDREPLIEKLEQAHVLVVPSSYEGYGIVYLEGMGFGLPAIGTTAGAASEIIRDGENGYLITPDDHSSLVTRLWSLAGDRDLLTRLSLNARRRYLRQPKWSQTAGEVRKFLLSFLK